MATDIFDKRTEKRYLIPKDKVEDTLSTLQGFNLYSPEGMDNTYLQSIYFGRHGEVNKKGLIRVRKYEKSELKGNKLMLNGDEQVYFEIKYKYGGKIDKKRGQLTYRKVVEKLLKPLESVGWVTSEVGIGKKEYESLVAEFDGLGLYPQFAILTNRQHFHSNNPQFNCRITIDSDVRYFAFHYGDPFVGIEMGKEPMDKLEIKVDESNAGFVDDMDEKIIEFGGIPIDTLQSKVETMCRETVKMFGWKGPSKDSDSTIESTPMHSLRNMEGVFVNEFDGEEFEMKIQVKPLEPQKLIEEIREILLKNQILNFSLLEDKQEISWWTYFMDYYGFKENDKTRMAFDVVRHPDKDKFMVQFKQDAQKHDNETAFVVARKEFKFRVERKFNSQDLETMLAYYSELVGKPVYFVGTNMRKKYYLFIFNKISRRYYNLGIDLNNCDGQVMVQLEIEYKGKHPDSKVKNDKGAVLSEMSSFVSEIKRLPHFDLEITDLRKFDWIKSIKEFK